MNNFRCPPSPIPKMSSSPKTEEKPPPTDVSKEDEKESKIWSSFIDLKYHLPKPQKTQKPKKTKKKQPGVKFKNKIINSFQTSMLVPDFLVWIDLEMTGLDISKEKIIEAACIITDMNLKIIDKFGPIIIKQEDSILDNMNEWCKKHHGESGLTAAVKKSEIDDQQAESMLLEFIQKHVKINRGFLAGNSVHADQKFLDKYWPKVTEYLHYRIVDVSSFKVVTAAWDPATFAKAPKKKLSHRALDDIEESIEELKFYKMQLFTN